MGRFWIKSRNRLNKREGKPKPSKNSRPCEQPAKSRTGQSKRNSPQQSRAHSVMRIHSHPTLMEKDKFSTSPAQQDKNKGADGLLCFSLCFLDKHPVEFGGTGLFGVFLLGGGGVVSVFLLLFLFILNPLKTLETCVPVGLQIRASGLKVCQEFPCQKTLQAKNSNNDFIIALQLLNHHGKWQISPHLLSMLKCLHVYVLCCFSMRPKRHKY